MSQGPTKGVPIDIDQTLSANSDFVVPSQKAVKAYVDNNLAAYGVITTVNFGASFTDKASTVVSGKTWVSASTCLSGTVLTTSDTDEAYLLDMQVVISNIVVGDGFTVTVYSQTEAKGTYTIMLIGVN